MPRFRNPIISTANIPDGAITTAKLADGAVASAKLADLAVEANKLADLAVSEAKLANFAVTDVKIGTSSVTTAKLGDLAVTTAKIGLLAVGSAQIGNLAVTAAKIANATITNAQIGSLNADKITAGIITALRFRTVAAGERLEIRGDTAEGFIRFFESGGAQIGLIGFFPTGFGANQMVMSAVAGAGITIETSGDLVLRGTNSMLVDAGSANVVFQAGQVSFSSVPTMFFAPNAIFQNGGPTAPGFSFAGDSGFNSGMYLIADNALGIAVGGANRLSIDSGGIRPHTSTVVNTANLVQTASGNRVFRSTSSARYKRMIRPWDRRASVLELTPSLYRARQRHDDPTRDRLGLIAEDVAAIFPLAAVLDERGRPDAVDWNAVTAGVIAELTEIEHRVATLEGNPQPLLEG